MRDRPAQTVGIAAGILLLLAIAPLPYGYYTFMRWCITAAAIVLSIMASKIDQRGWLYVFVPVAILFNPIAPVHMPRESWAFFNLAGAALMFYAGNRLSRPST